MAKEEPKKTASKEKVQVQAVSTKKEQTPSLAKDAKSAKTNI